MLSAEALEFHSHHPLWPRGQHIVRESINLFGNKDGANSQTRRVDKYGRTWIVEVQPYHGLLGMIRIQELKRGWRSVEHAVITGINDQFHYENEDTGQRLHGEKAVSLVEGTFVFLREHSTKLGKLE